MSSHPKWQPFSSGPVCVDRTYSYYANARNSSQIAHIHKKDKCHSVKGKTIADISIKTT